MAAKKVSIINFKGGVGKTTLAFHLSAYLSAHQATPKRVLMIDVDHQSSLSIVAMSAGVWEDAVSAGRTCNKIFDSFCKRSVPLPGNEIVTKEPLQTRTLHPYPNLDLVAAQFELDDTEIELASTTVGGPTVSEWDKRTLLAQWLDKVEVDKHYDYVVFDCPPATKLVSQNALAASDYFVIPVIPDEMSSRGVTHFRNLVQNKIDAKLEFLRQAAGVTGADVPKSYNPKTKLAGIAPFLARVAGRAESGLTNIHTEQLAALHRQWGKDMLDTVVKNLTGVPESMNAGWPVWFRRGERNVTGEVLSMMTNVCREIVERLK